MMALPRDLPTAVTLEAGMYVVEIRYGRLHDAMRVDLRRVPREDLNRAMDHAAAILARRVLEVHGWRGALGVLIYSVAPPNHELRPVAYSILARHQ